METQDEKSGERKWEYRREISLDEISDKTAEGKEFVTWKRRYPKGSLAGSTMVL
jgi:hypothetical protein